MPTQTESGFPLTEEAGSTVPDGDMESIERGFGEIYAVRQGLHQRHIQMIALAGTIGTGLFLGSGQAIATAGPLGAFLGYTIVGLAVSGVVLCGEMGALVPLSGGLIRYAEFFFDPAISFANGWNQVYLYLVAIPAEIVAASVLIEFWITVNNAIWITVFSILVLVTALVFVRIYGELEFAFAILKILLIIGVNIMALVITCGGGPDGESIGFRYWRDPGPFVQYLGIKGSPGSVSWFLVKSNNASMRTQESRISRFPELRRDLQGNAIPRATSASCSASSSSMSCQSS